MKKLILFLIVGISLMSFVYAVETFTPIFCNDYEFTCCGGRVESSQSYPITDESPWTCPDYAYKCKITTGTLSGKIWYVGSGDCKIAESGLFGVCHEYKCSSQSESITEMNPGDKIYLSNGGSSCGDITGNVQIKILRSQLGFCGRSGSVGEETTCGVEVSGADGCKFSPINNVVYTSTSSLTGKEQTSSYTVSMSQCVLAFQSGDRHICGYKEESCSSDSECSGHTYGNKECNGRKLQTYGCRDYGTPINEKDRGPFDGGWGTDAQKPSQSGSANFGKRCEITNAENVECCGDTDCGNKYFCDKSTFTCKENVECYKDTDCGVSTQCDQYSLTLKKPVCSNGKCGFDESKVDCCSNANCNGGYCNQNKCQASSSNSNIPSKDMAGITGAAIGSSGFNLNYLWMGLGILLVIGLIAGSFVMSKRNQPAATQILDGEKCSSCSQTNKKGTKHCIGCGKKLTDEPSGVKCSNCGSSNNITKKFCTNCGKKL